MSKNKNKAFGAADASLSALPAGSSAGDIPPTTKTLQRSPRRLLRLHGTIARDLGVLIVSGTYKAGEILDGEIEASDRLRVSRGAYREAVRILAAKGLVESKPKVGTRISPPERWHLLDPDVLAWIFESEPDEALITSLFELRRIVEPHAAALAAKRRNEQDLTEMATALDGMATHSLAVEAGQIADQAFHSVLLRAGRNPFLVSLTSGIGAAVSWTTIFKKRLQSVMRDPIPEHRRVYEAIRASDPVAAHQTMEHLLDTSLLDALNARRQAASGTS